MRFFSSVSGYVRWKVSINENISFIDHASGIQLTSGCKLAINQKKDNGITICWHDVIITFFWRWCVCLVNFSYWSKFQVNIMTDSRVLTIYFYKGLTRKPEIGNTTTWALPNIWRLGRMSLIKRYWILQNAGVTDFTVSKLFFTQIRVNSIN